MVDKEQAQVSTPLSLTSHKSSTKSLIFELCYLAFDLIPVLAQSGL